MYYKRRYKYPIYPTEEQATQFNRMFGCCRKIWNVLLNILNEEYDLYTQGLGPKPSYSKYDIASRITALKALPEYHYLSETSRITLNIVAHNLASSHKSFFEGRSYRPKFKSKYDEQSFHYDNGTRYRFQFHDDPTNSGVEFIKLEKVPGVVKMVVNRTLPIDQLGRITAKGCTITRDRTGQHYISFACEREGTKTHGTGIIGIDLGLKDLVITSTGEKIPNTKALKKHETRLAALQRVLATKLKGSSNYRKLKLRIAKLHKKIVSIRQHALHSISKYLVSNNHVIALETLNTKAMMMYPTFKSLAKHIGDAAWSTLVNYIIYKAEESEHCVVVKVSSDYPSTHLCSNCGWKTESMGLDVREWYCDMCDTEHDRDANAASNIRNEAVRVLANEYPGIPMSTLGGRFIVSNKCQVAI